MAFLDAFDDCIPLLVNRFVLLPLFVGTCFFFRNLFSSILETPWRGFFLPRFRFSTGMRAQGFFLELFSLHH